MCVTLDFDRAGTSQRQCAEFCGLRHADMVFRVGRSHAGDSQRGPRDGMSVARSSRRASPHGSPAGLARHQHRPQADRAEPRAYVARVLPAGWRVRAADARPARITERAPAVRRLLQRAVHDARLDDDLPVRDADGDRDGDVSGAAADRRAGDQPARAPRCAGFWIWLCRRADDAVRLAHRGRRRPRRLDLVSPRCRTAPTPRASGRTCGCSE